MNDDACVMSCATRPALFSYTIACLMFWFELCLLSECVSSGWFLISECVVFCSSAAHPAHRGRRGREAPGCYYRVWPTPWSHGQAAVGIYID